MKRWRFHINHSGPHTPYTLYRYIILKWGYSNIPTVKKRFQSPSLSGRKKKVYHSSSLVRNPGRQSVGWSWESKYFWILLFVVGRTDGLGGVRDLTLAGCVDCCPPLSPPACCKTSSHLQTFAPLKLWRAERWLGLGETRSSWWLIIVL